jgi:hypothetical protein
VGLFLSDVVHIQLFVGTALADRQKPEGYRIRSDGSAKRLEAL